MRIQTVRSCPSRSRSSSWSPAKARCSGSLPGSREDPTGAEFLENRRVWPRTRILAFGSAALLALAGVLCFALFHTVLGLVLGVVLLSFGLGAVVLLVFLEVGLSEDHARERE